MEVIFSKLSSLGSDNIVFDNRDGKYNALFQNKKKLAFLCDRNFGIGAGGIVEIGSSSQVRLYGTTGDPAKFGGTPAICATAFAKWKGLLANENTFHFECHGEHTGQWNRSENNYSVTFKDIGRDSISEENSRFILTAGCPHLIIFVGNVKDIDVEGDGRKLSADFRESGGINVNYVQRISGSNDEFEVRTYCRTTDNELRLCGSGSIAVAVVSEFKNNISTEVMISRKKLHEKKVSFPGGVAQVSFTRAVTGDFEDIKLTVPAAHIFDGKITLEL